MRNPHPFPSNPWPTPREEAALKDVLRFPAASLTDRLERLDVKGRSGVLYLLRRLTVKGSVEHDGRYARSWSVTLAGRRWLRPTARSEAR